jgi:hypothetical protein
VQVAYGPVVCSHDESRPTTPNKALCSVVAAKQQVRRPPALWAEDQCSASNTVVSMRAVTESRYAAFGGYSTGGGTATHPSTIEPIVKELVVVVQDDLG